MLPLMLKMALPSVAAQLVNLLYNMVDRIFIGHMGADSTMALAGVGVCSPVIILISAFASFVSGGAAPLCSMAIGSKDYRKASRLFNNSVTLLVFFTVILSSLTWIFMTPLLRAVGASDATFPYARRYLNIYLTGTAFVMVTMGLNTFMNVQGRPGVSMMAVIIGALLNIALDPLFIFVFSMGVGGAALATVISQAVSCLFLLRYLSSPEMLLHFQIEDMKLDKAIVSSIFSLGVASFVMAATDSLIGLVLNRNLASYGDIYVSTLTILQSCMQLFSVPLGGFSQGTTPIISYNFGRKDRKRIVEYWKVIVSVMFLGNFVFVIWELAAPGMFARIFTSDEQLILLVRQMMPYFMTGMALFGVQRACQNMFVGMNQAGTSLFIALLRKVILLVPLAYILPHIGGLGVKGVFLAEAVADGTCAILCTLIFTIRFPKILKKMETP